MSCLIIDPITIREIATTAYSYAFGGDGLNRPEMPWAATGFYASPTKVGEKAIQYMRDLYVLNHIAYRECYHDEKLTTDYINATVTEELDKYKVLAVKKNLNVYQMLKACECLLYQISDIKNYEKKKCVNWLCETINALRRNIVSNLPEYKAAEWLC